MLKARLVIGFNAAILALFGIWGLVAPEHLAELAGLAATRPNGIVEISANYGGLELGASLLCLYTLFDRQRLRWGLLFSIALVGGLAVGRTLGLIHYGVHEFDQLMIACVEWVFTGFALFVLKSSGLDD